MYDTAAIFKSHQNNTVYYFCVMIHQRKKYFCFQGIAAIQKKKKNDLMRFPLWAATEWWGGGVCTYPPDSTSKNWECSLFFYTGNFSPESQHLLTFSTSQIHCKINVTTLNLKKNILSSTCNMVNMVVWDFPPTLWFWNFSLTVKIRSVHIENKELFINIQRL